MKLLARYGMAMTGLLLGVVCACAYAAQVEIIAPAQQGTVHNNAGDLTVAVKVEPSLDPQERTTIRILLDGKPAAPDSARMKFDLRGVERGQHWLQALLIDRQGQTLSVSDTVYFTMWQASIKNPPRRKN